MTELINVVPEILEGGNILGRVKTVFLSNRLKAGILSVKPMLAS